MADAERTFLAALMAKQRFLALNAGGDTHFMRMRAHFARKMAVDFLLEREQIDPSLAIAAVDVIVKARRTRYRDEETGKPTYHVRAKETAR